MKFSSNSARALAYLFTSMATTWAALAHPGHPIKDSSAAHLATSPYHLGMLAGGGLLLFGAALCIRQQTPRRLAQFAGVAALASAVVLWGVRG